MSSIINLIFLHRKLIGIVINTTFCWNNETAILSLVAGYQDIAREFIQRFDSKILTFPKLQPATKCDSKNAHHLLLFNKSNKNSSFSATFSCFNSIWRVLGHWMLAKNKCSQANYNM